MGLMPGKPDVWQAYMTKPPQDVLPHVPQRKTPRVARGRQHIQRISSRAVPGLLNVVSYVSVSQHSNASENLWHGVGAGYTQVSQENQSQKNISKQSKQDTTSPSQPLKDYWPSIIWMNPAFV